MISYNNLLNCTCKCNEFDNKEFLAEGEVIFFLHLDDRMYNTNISIGVVRNIRGFQYIIRMSNNKARSFYDPLAHNNSKSSVGESWLNVNLYRWQHPGVASWSVPPCNDVICNRLILRCCSVHTPKTGRVVWICVCVCVNARACVCLRMGCITLFSTPAGDSHNATVALSACYSLGWLLILVAISRTYTFYRGQ